MIGEAGGETVGFRAGDVDFAVGDVDAINGLSCCHTQAARTFCDKWPVLLSYVLLSYFIGSRATDDGVKAAATDSMAAITKIPGQYNTHNTQYQPPPPYQTWSEVVQKSNPRLSTGNWL